MKAIPSWLFAENVTCPSCEPRARAPAATVTTGCVAIAAWSGVRTSHGTSGTAVQLKL